MPFPPLRQGGGLGARALTWRLCPTFRSRASNAQSIAAGRRGQEFPFRRSMAPLEHPSGRPPDEEHQRHDDDTQRRHQQEAILVGRHGGFEDELPLHQAQ